MLLQEIVFWSLAGIVFFQVFYQWFFYSRMAFARAVQQQGQKKPVSVVVCARDEEDNLRTLLPLLLTQDYPQYEVVVVNDGSQDETEYLLEDLKRTHPHLKVVNLKENVNFFKGKKLALAVGIKSASYDTLLLTDADCVPQGKDWISMMEAKFTDGKRIVLGYGGYHKEKGFLNKLIRFDTLITASRYMSFAMAGVPYMGVGRNMAYSKKLFYEAGGFASHYKIMSGDDDLFVNQVAKGKNTAVQFLPGSFTYSKPKKRFMDWFRQKKRHLTTGRYYKGHHKFLLGLEALLQPLFYVAAIWAILLFFRWEIVIGIIAFKYLSYLLVLYYTAKRVNERELFLYSPLFDLLFAFLNPIFAISNMVVKTNKWK